MTGSAAVMVARAQGLDLGALASPLGTPLRSAASPFTSSPLQGFWVDCSPCPCKPNHQHLPLTSSLIGNPSAAARPGSSSIHSSSEQSVPFFFSAKAAFPLPLSAPSAAKPAAKARFLFPFCFFMVPFIYRLCFFLALAPIQRGREAKGGEQYHS